MDKDKLYRDVLKCARTKDFKGVCTGVQILLGLRNELPRLLAFFIDTYLSNEWTCFWDRSVSANQIIVECLEKIMALPKRQILKNELFQELFIKLLVSCLSVHEYYGRNKWTAAVVGIDGARLDAKLESTFMCLEIYPECKLVTKSFRKLMTVDMARLFDVLYYFLRKGDRKLAQLLAKHILCKQHISFDRVPSDCGLFDDVKEDCKVDVVWYVWWFLVMYVKKMKKDKHGSHWHYAYKLVELSFSIFKTMYTKKARERRVDLLYGLIYIIMSEHMEDADGLVKTPDEVHALSALLFGESNRRKIDSVPLHTCERDAQSYNVNSSSNNLNSSSNSGINRGERVETKVTKQCKYLECIIYDDDED